MEAIYTKLMAEARAKHGAILPLGGRDNLSEGFCCQDGFVQFWFSTPDNSSHLVYQELSGAAS